MKVEYREAQKQLLIHSSISEEAFDLGKLFSKLHSLGFEVYEDNRGVYVQLKDVPQNTKEAKRAHRTTNAGVQQ